MGCEEMNLKVHGDYSSDETLEFKLNLVKSQNDSIKRNEHIYRMALDMSDDVFLYEDCIDNKITVSDRFYSFFNITNGAEITKKTVLDCVSDNDKYKIYQIFNSESCQEEQAKVTLNDDKTYLKIVKRVNVSEAGEPIEKIYYFKNITSVAKKNEELKYMAYYDSLTGLYNRNYFVQVISKLVERAKEENNTVAVMYLDIDDFKHVNDTLGFVSGDEVVQMLGQEIRSYLTEDMYGARVGNDVFGIAIYNPVGIRSYENMMSRIKERLKKPFVLISKAEIMLTVSVGVVDYPECGDNALDLLKNAEIAMANVKGKGKNGVGYFNVEMYNSFLKEINLEKKLNKAIEEESFVLKFQPQYDVESNRLRGVEALVRWVDKDGNAISPESFIPLAERNGKIIAIGDWVMENAIDTLARWQQEYGYDGIMSINISTIQIKKDDFVRKLKNTIDKYNVRPEEVEIEITETVLIDDLESIIDKINKIRAYGIRVSLDDFGVGYSSLAYLKDLPIDTLKIDKSFIDDVMVDKSTDIITQAIIAMVKNLGMETVAEGVENKEQYEYLKKMKCDNIQGFLLGKPMTSEEIEKMLSR